MCSRQIQKEGEGEEVKGVNYTCEEEEAVRRHFNQSLREKKVPVLEEVRKFLAAHAWIKRSDTSVRDKCRNIIRRQLE